MTQTDSLILATLDRRSRADLLVLWRTHYDAPPPRNVSQRLLRQAIAHRLQCRIHGGLSRSAADTLARIAALKDRQSLRPILDVRPAIKPGTRFIRDWRGETHEVTVDADGRFLWRGAAYASLSVIARQITGVRRNGPAFFGLRRGAADGG